MPTFKHPTTLGSATLIAAAILCANPIHAQFSTGLQRRDSFSSIPHGLIVAGDRELLLKASGDQSTRPAAAPTPTGSSTPHFSFASIFGSLPIYIDAVSTGNDLLPLNKVVFEGEDEYVVAPGDQVWAAMAISVSPDATGTDIVGARVTASGSGVAADLMSLWFADNEIVGGTFNDQTFLLASHQHLGLGNQDDIRGLDTYIPSIIAAQGVPTPVFMPSTDAMYFSLTAASAQYIRDLWPALSSRFDSSVAKDDVTGGTIFRVIWQASSSGWSSISKAFRFSELGLNADADVDALAYYRYQPTSPEVVVVSATKATTPVGAGQVFIGSGGRRYALRDSRGRRIAQRIGLSAGDVTAICGYDPHMPPHTSTYWATPVNSNDRPEILGISAHRTLNATGYGYHIQVTGLSDLPGTSPGLLTVTGTAISPAIGSVPLVQGVWVPGPDVVDLFFATPNHAIGVHVEVEAEFVPFDNSPSSLSWPLHIQALIQ